MSLLMQALRKAERARSHNADEHEAEHQFGQDAGPSMPPIEGGPAFAVMPDAWRLEPLEAEPPVIAAQEAAHDPVPPQARHEPARGPAQRAPAAPEQHLPPRSSVREPGARPLSPPRAVASSQRRLIVLAGTLGALLVVFAFIYWRAVYGPGPGAHLPMVPMPAPGAAPLAQAGAAQDAAIVIPYPGAANGEPAMQDAAAIPGSPIAQAPATTPVSKPPPTNVAIPTPAQLAAIADPAIRAEAMRDAAERAARQVQLEGASPVAGTAVATPAQVPQRSQALDTTSRTASTAATASGKHSPPTAVGQHGDVRFVRSAAAIQVTPAIEHGYAALQAGDLATARQQYDLALLQDPNSRDALLGSAAVALREHDGRQASSNYLRLLELDPNDPEALAGLAEVRPGDLQADEVKLRGLARQHPASGAVQFALGNLYARQGRWAEAQQSYFHAFSAMPDNADYAFNLAVGLDRMNQPRLAQTYYRRALELAQASPPGFNADAVRQRLQVLATAPQ